MPVRVTFTQILAFCLKPIRQAAVVQVFLPHPFPMLLLFIESVALFQLAGLVALFLAIRHVVDGFEDQYGFHVLAAYEPGL